MLFISIYGPTCHTVVGSLRPHTPMPIHIQMISIYRSTCRIVAGSLRPHTPMPIHGPGCKCKWFPYMGPSVALSQALSGPHTPMPIHGAWVYNMLFISIYGPTCCTVAGSLRPHTPMPIHGPGCICKWFPYMGPPVALVQAHSGPILSCHIYHCWG